MTGDRYGPEILFQEWQCAKYTLWHCPICQFAVLISVCGVLSLPPQTHKLMLTIQWSQIFLQFLCVGSLGQSSLGPKIDTRKYKWKTNLLHGQPRLYLPWHKQCLLLLLWTHQNINSRLYQWAHTVGIQKGGIGRIPAVVNSRQLQTGGVLDLRNYFLYTA